MVIFSRLIPKKANQFVALGLILLIGFSPVIAGISITNSNGIVMTGADGIVMTGADGIVMTGADGFLNASTNGIVMTGADGIVMTGADGMVMTGADGIVMTGADGYAYPNSVQSASANSLTLTQANGIVMTGADGIVMTGADGTAHTADSVTISQANGIVMTGADGIVMTGADGVQQTASNGIVMTGADGIVMTGADGIVMTGADSVNAVSTTGEFYSVAPDGLTFTGVTGIVTTGADGIVMTGADGIVMTGADGVIMSGTGSAPVGLKSVDPELAITLNRLTDDSGVNAVVVYHSQPGDSDLADLHRIGVIGGTRFRVLPAVVITATKSQLIEISRLPSVRSIYGNRTLNLTSEPEVRAVTGVDRAREDSELISANHSLSVTGRNVTVAVLDSGIDSTHGDLAGRVVKNVKLVDTQSVGVGFNYPINLENLPNTDLVLGHGTFVAGLIGGSGTRSAGRFAGVAPDARLVGLSAGDVTLIHILSGLDYVLSHKAELGIRVLNCSFSANTAYDRNDPVNVATKMLTDAGVNVVFSAGNTGPGANTLNPYAVAPWVVSVGATDTQGRLASFSSRGSFGSPLFHPTLVAPGVNVVSTRGLGVPNVTGVLGLVDADLERLTLSEIPFYTTASGTSFSAPQVAGAIALMLEANPNLSPAEVRDILQRTATPLPPYHLYEVGAGMLNVHAAVLEAEFSRRIGSWRGILNRRQVRFINDAPVQFGGMVYPGGTSTTNITVPEGALAASIQIGWGPLTSPNDLGLSIYDPAGTLRAQSNTLNVPGLNGKRERAVINLPAPGTWRVVVRSPFGWGLTTQSYVGVLEIARAQYSVSDLGPMASGLRGDVEQNLRTNTMMPIGTRFRPDFGVSRSDLAMSLVLGARVPHYVPSQPTYQDVQYNSSRLFVESVQASPNGALFVDVAPGGSFRPNDVVTRLVAAVALVRAAGYRAEADDRAGIPLAYPDGASVPSHLRGYVSVAVSRGLMQSDSLFRPQNSFTRGELARALALIETRAIQ